ncbi:GHKL domain-containing protein [Evansella sp. AB-rgal1]|uniref:GHKL domain-containing protein n=1 Tax=Evansella sp. AB-rgal1 TaxID=3242696 RepID=UPI00359E925B
MLDNAYDATLEMPDTERKIELKIVRVNETVKLIVRNTSILKEFTEKHFKIGYSSKSNLDRGYGLAIIQEVTDKYHGLLKVDTNDNVVSVEISFPKVVEKGSIM